MVRGGRESGLEALGGVGDALEDKAVVGTVKPEEMVLGVCDLPDALENKRTSVCLHHLQRDPSGRIHSPLSHHVGVDALRLEPIYTHSESICHHTSPHITTTHHPPTTHHHTSPSIPSTTTYSQTPPSPSPPQRTSLPTQAGTRSHHNQTPQPLPLLTCLSLSLLPRQVPPVTSGPPPPTTHHTTSTGPPTQCPHCSSSTRPTTGPLLLPSPSQISTTITIGGDTLLPGFPG